MAVPNKPAEWLARAAEANDIANSVLKVSSHPKRNVVIKAAVKGQMPDLDWKTFAK